MLHDQHLHSVYDFATEKLIKCELSKPI
jgi:hypothetical protein